MAKDRLKSAVDRSTFAGLERAKGIEPSYAAWEAAVLPLNYARKIANKINVFCYFLT
jgi:hypothetical protein